jgi:hypothetical protein
VTHIASYRLRNPDAPDEVYGNEIEDQQDALRRGQELADFYRHPVEVCRVAVGRIVLSIATLQPGPTAPGSVDEEAR